MDFSKELGLRVLLCPFGSNIVVRTACCSVGTVLPVYSTFKAIERRNQDEQQKWLVYWAVYGSFSAVEVFSDKVLSWFPLYYHVKFAFLVWLQLPSTLGATKLYRNHLRSFLLRHQATLDQFAEFMYSGMVTFMNAYEGQIQLAKGLFFRTVSLVRCLIPPDEKLNDLAAGSSGRGRRLSDAQTEPERSVQLDDEGWTVLPGDIDSRSPESQVGEF